MCKSNDDIQALYLAIGYVITKMSFIEAALAQCVATIFHCCTEKLPDRPLPKFLMDKARFVREALTTLNELKSFKKDGINILDRIANIKDRRDDFAHSVLKNLVVDNGVYHFVSLEAKPDIHEIREWDFDVRSFPKLSERLEALTDDIQKYAAHLEAAYPQGRK